ncbi:MAG TPA: hypothetical protein VHL30_01720 [Chlamydiales bacterium]|nr:hypothetical protein [Chlamydiales bacterium]
MTEEIKLTENLCRIKVNHSDLLIQDDGMYYLCKNRYLIPISGVQLEDGSYIATAPKGLIEDVFGIWWCYNCQNWNSKFDISCQYCGRPK